MGARNDFTLPKLVRSRNEMGPIRRDDTSA